MIKRTRDDSRAALERAEQKASPRARSPRRSPSPIKSVALFVAAASTAAAAIRGSVRRAGPAAGLFAPGHAAPGLFERAAPGLPPHNPAARHAWSVPQCRNCAWSRRWRERRSTQVACRRGASRPSSSRRRSGSRAARRRCSSPSRRRRPAVCAHSKWPAAGRPALPQCGNANFPAARGLPPLQRAEALNKRHHHRPVVEKEPLVDKFEDDDEAFDAGIAGVIKRPPNANGQRRTKMCMAIQEGRACRFGQACTYAHSTAEPELGSRMAPADPNARREDGSLKWQPHLRKTKLCRFFMERGGDCPYGARCNFAHGEDHSRARGQPSQDFLQRQGPHAPREPRRLRK